MTTGTSAELSRLIAKGERELEAAKKNHKEALAACRAACPHATAVEISRAWTECPGDVEKRRATAFRFCLDCGEMEHGTSYVLGLPKPHFQFRWLEKAEIVRRETCGPDAEGYLALLEVFRGRLHDAGRFDEFDGQGVWLGPNAGIVRGED